MEQILNTVLSARAKAVALHPDRPFVCLTWAQSADGMIAAAPGERTLISGDESMVMTHMLRAIHDAILVGIGTVRADNPRLNCRLKDQERLVVDAALARHGTPSPQNEDRSPTAVVLDRNARMSTTAKLLSQLHCGELNRLPFLFCGADNDQVDKQNMKALAHVVRLESVPLDSEKTAHGESVSTLLSLPAVMKKLRDLEISSVMVEGGATVLSSFLKSGLYDLVIITIAPTLFGNGLSLASGSTRVPFSITRLSDPVWVPCGEDVVLVGAPS